MMAKLEEDKVGRSSQSVLFVSAHQQTVKANTLYLNSAMKRWVLNQSFYHYTRVSFPILLLQRREKREHIDAITLKLLELTPKKQRLDVSYLLDKKRQQKKPQVVDV